MNPNSNCEAVERDDFVRILRPITLVRPDEVTRVLLFTLNFFLLFTSYYMLKPIRESLILSLSGGAEIKSFVSAIQAVTFIALVPIYSALVNRFSGRQVLVFIYVFLALNLLVFIGLGIAEFQYLGIAFFIWLGMYNLLIVSQTWSLCSDIYSPEQGKRLFPLLACGPACGGAFGSLVLVSEIRSHGVFGPMAVAAGLLLACAVLVYFITPKLDSIAAKPSSPPAQKSSFKDLLGGLDLVFSNQYVLLVAGLVLIINFVNTTSEYMMGKLVAEHLREQIATGMVAGQSLSELIGIFYGKFYFWVNTLELFLQLFVVSRVVRIFGVRAALLALPILALCSYSLIFFFPFLAFLRLVKIAENGSNYSLNNTAREILFLPLTREEKYKAKFAVDTCFWRAGDALSGLSVLIIATLLGLGITVFAAMNIVLVAIWIFLVIRIARKRKKLLNPTISHE
jgi:ATP:ADP antiporter, AAA family